MNEKYLMLVFYKEDGYHVCHSLATHILFCAESQEEAKTECLGMIETHWKNAKKYGVLNLFYRAAPKEYFDKYGDQL